jgi:4-hydroxy-4-methyl-2-oxoglutarate aldolase
VVSSSASRYNGASRMSSAQPAAANIDYLLSVDSPTLSNAIEMLNVRPRSAGFTPLQLRCLFPEFGRMCGYAVTAQVETMTQTEPLDLGRFVDLYQAVTVSPKPAIIVFQEIGAQPDYAAHCGEVMATTFLRCGAVGLVSDSGVRDVPEVRALKFQYFARGTVASHAYFRIVRVNVPVQVMGVVVQPGDILHGDENGLIQVPQDTLAGLPEAVDTIRTRERELMDYVRSEAFTIPGLRAKIAPE